MKERAMKRRSILTSLGIVSVLSFNCGDSTEPLRPTYIALIPSTVTLDALGATEQLSAQVLDQNRQPLQGEEVTWSSDDLQVATVSTDGLVTAVRNGTAQITASFGSIDEDAAVTVSQVVTAFQKEAGDAQTGAVNQALPQAMVVRAADRLGSPVLGASVNFSAASGSGGVSPASAATGSDGRASTTWTLGTTAGENTLTATIAGVAPLSFTATGTPGPAAIITKESGDNQTGTAGLPVADPPTVKVTDAFGNVISDVAVSFAVASGGGSVTDENPSTAVDGTAAVGSWTLGATVGMNELTATVSGVTPVTFTANGVIGATTIVKQAGDNQSALVGTSVTTPATVLLTDASSNPVVDQQVVFDVASGGGSITLGTTTTNAGGLASVGSWTLGTTAGGNTLTATTQGLAPVTFTATGTSGAAVGVVLNDGDGQTGLVDFGVNIPPSVKVVDSYGNGVEGIGVTFTVMSGGGSVEDVTPTSDSQGIAVVDKWTLGAAPGTNTLGATASVGTVGFTATGVTSSYDIEIQFLSSATSSQQQAFIDAKDRWEELLIGDLSNIPVNVPADQCGPGSPAINQTIDDVLIFATIDSIDGPGSILGQAGPCLIRSSSQIPVAGFMIFDEADLGNLEAGGQLDEVIVHEMGHVIGLGTVWDNLGLLIGAGGSDPYFIGVRAIEAFDRIGGSSYTGNKVPVENTGGGGTRDSHWRESIFDNELMTGWIDAGLNPLSEQTVASFWDVGYLVNLDGADDFSIGGGLRTFTEGVAVKLVDDVLSIPIYVVDESGRVVGVIERR